MNNKSTNLTKRITQMIFDSKVTILFLLLFITAAIISGKPLTFIVPELFTRIARNGFLIMSLIVPILAGMGLNFGIVIGAMAAQISLFITIYWGLTGISGFLITALLAMPIAAFLGTLVGKLFNQMKGSEMIGGLVLGYFADGFYWLLFLFAFGGVIAFDNSTLMITSDTSAYNPVSINTAVKYAAVFYLVLTLLLAAIKKAKHRQVSVKALAIKCGLAVFALVLTFIAQLEPFLSHNTVTTGIGVKNSIDLMGIYKYALDTVPMIKIAEYGFYSYLIISLISLAVKIIYKQKINWKSVVIKTAIVCGAYALTFIPVVDEFMRRDKIYLINAVDVLLPVTLGWQAAKWFNARFIEKKAWSWQKAAAAVAGGLVVYLVSFIPSVYEAFKLTQIPVMTYLCIGGICLLNNGLMNTKLGQDMRTVGQNRTVANAAGIDVDKTRIIAMVFSTVLAACGQLIYLQNLGTMQTFGHTMVAQYAIAALLVGGASIDKATNKQALLGVFLFHALFVVAAPAIKVILGGDAGAVEEYFRAFVSYGVIALALALHAWKNKSVNK